MKRRILMVSAMILLLGSQVQIHAHKKGGPDFKRPGIEVRIHHKPGKPINRKAICHADIERLQRFYIRNYGIWLSRQEAERILLVEMRDRNHKAHGPGRPHPRPHR